MSNLQPVSQSDEPGHPSAPKVVDPKLNPSYPLRVHAGERAQWREKIRICDDKLAPFREKLAGLAPGPARAPFERHFAQMLGARDQVAEAVLRLPQETGDLYKEDKHRLEEALASLDRVIARWGAAGEP